MTSPVIRRSGATVTGPAGCERDLRRAGEGPSPGIHDFRVTRPQPVGCPDRFHFFGILMQTIGNVWLWGGFAVVVIAAL
ncbi:hypothetical protein, partial [Xanthomonas axonopodis]|uniref:hypothetical protein n=1 Tax=Xanthomonas axonopodis TaxID=53413 RepID=UPI001C27F977